jgi:hypothetical protein
MKMQFILTFFLAIALCQCTDIKPLTKANYLHRYHQFILFVEQKHTAFSASDWQGHDVTYKHFTEDWYADYKPQLSKDELRLVQELSLKYHYYKLLAIGNNIGSTFDQWLLDTENRFIKE